MDDEPYPEGWPDWVRRETTVHGGCILWDGPYDNRGRCPIDINPNGRHVNIKRLLLQEPGDRVSRYTTSCGSGRCLAPDHQRWRMIPDQYAA
jgi:hypothetical protein